MKKLQLAAIALLVVLAGSEGRAQQVPPSDDGVQQLVQRLQTFVQAGDVVGYLDLVAGTADRTRAIDFGRSEIQTGATRAVLKERDRVPLAAGSPETGYRIVLDAFVEFGRRARIATWQLDIRPRDGIWHIVAQERLTAVDNLYRLSLDVTRQFNAANLTITGEDLDVLLESGSAFLVPTEAGVTGLVLIGRGEMRFHPAPETEKGQVRIYCGSETLVARFDSAFIRLEPGEFDRLVKTERLVSRAVDARDVRKATGIFEEDSVKSFHLGQSDLSADSWSLMPNQGNMVAEIHTRRYGTLTYARSRNEAEDITLFDRSRRRTISSYASLEKIARRGLSYNEDDFKDYDILDYKVDLTVLPDRQWIDGVAQVTMRVRGPSMSSLTLRLAESLVVRSISSDRLGRLFGFRIRNQNSIVINLPALMLHDAVMTLTIAYSGRLESQPPDGEAVAVGQGQDQGETFEILAESSYLYSNRSAWYPQATVTDYATATLKISLPPLYGCVASGELQTGWPQMAGEREDQSLRKVYSFSASQPVRYLAFLVSRFVRSDPLKVTFDAIERRDAEGAKLTLDVVVEANPRQARRAAAIAERVGDMATFYASLVDDVPYPAFTVALVEHDLPGGHSPAYFAELLTPLPRAAITWRNDPAAFDRYPDFFLAHELAHQWWGQAVGWQNYHEQWISEGFAQYFAALYAQRQRGDGVFAAVMRQMRRWAMSETDQGPVYLGYRLGHLQGDGRIFRAVVYNKSATVLHMLRRLIGDEAFFRGVRRFYTASRFSKAGTDDFKRAVEAEAGRSLDRFFDRWIYGSTLPRLKVGYQVEGTDLAVRIEQLGEIFEVPVTLTLEYTDRRRLDVVVPITDRTAEVRVPLTGTLRDVAVSRDDGTLAEIVK